MTVERCTIRDDAIVDNYVFLDVYLGISQHYIELYIPFDDVCLCLDFDARKPF